MRCPRCGPVTPAANPNLKRSCPRCGRKVLTPRVTEARRAGQPNPPRDVPRDVDLERQLTREAARAAGINAEHMIAFSEARTLPGLLHDVDRRNMLQETREELADARNYLCWRAQLMIQSGDADDLPRVGALLSGLLALWHDLDELDA